VKTQVWIAVCVYVLVAIMKKRLNLTESLYTILQILSVTSFEKVPFYQLVTEMNYKNPDQTGYKQLNYSNINRTLVTQSLYLRLSCGKTVEENGDTYDK
jgi:hypothetical protein